MKKVFSVEEIKEVEAQEFKKRKGNSFSLMVDAGTNCGKRIAKLIKMWVLMTHLSLLVATPVRGVAKRPMMRRLSLLTTTSVRGSTQLIKITIVTGIRIFFVGMKFLNLLLLTMM